MIELKRFLESKKISQAEFSRKTGIDKFQLSKFVNGVLALNKVSLDKIKAGYPDFNYNVEQLKIINPDPSTNIQTRLDSLETRVSLLEKIILKG